MSEREDELRATMEDGDNARRLLNDPWLAQFFQRCTDEVREEYEELVDIEGQDPVDPEKIQEKRRELRALQAIFDKLAEIDQDGQSAANKIKDLHLAEKRAKSRETAKLAAHDLLTDYSSVGVKANGGDSPGTS